jgi:hypothetical protein
MKNLIFKLKVQVFDLKAKLNLSKIKSTRFEFPVYSEHDIMLYKDNIIQILEERKKLENENNNLKNYQWLTRVLYKYKLYNEENKIIAALKLEKNQKELNEKINIILQYILQNKINWGNSSFHSPFLAFICDKHEKLVYATTLANLLIIYPKEHFKIYGNSFKHTFNSMIKLLEYKTMLRVYHKITYKKKIKLFDKAEYLHFLNCLVYLKKSVNQEKVIWLVLKRYLKINFEMFNLRDMIMIFNFNVLCDRRDKRYLVKFIDRINFLLGSEILCNQQGQPGLTNNEVSDILANLSLFILNLKMTGFNFDIIKLCEVLRNYEPKNAKLIEIILKVHGDKCMVLSSDYSNLNMLDLLQLSLFIDMSKQNLLFLREFINSLYFLNEMQPNEFFKINLFCILFENLNGSEEDKNKFKNFGLKHVAKHLKELIFYNLINLADNIKKIDERNNFVKKKLQSNLRLSFIAIHSKISKKDNDAKFNEKIYNLLKENIHIICANKGHIEQLNPINKIILQTDGLYKIALEQI